MKKTLIIILIISFINSKALAEDFVNKRLDFREAILIALECNHDIRAMKNALSATERDIGVSRSAFFPKITFGEDFMETNNPAQVLALLLNQRNLTAGDLAAAPRSLNDPPSISNFLTYGLATVPLFGMTGIYAHKIAKLKYSAQGYLYLRKQEELIKNVALAYLAIGTAQEYVNIAGEDLKDANEHKKIANMKYRDGSGGYSDFLRANTEVSEAEQKLNSAQKNLDVAKRALGLLLGSKESIEIANSTPTLDLKIIDYYKAYSVYRNDIKAMEVNVKNAKEGVKLAIADWSPTMYGITSVNFNNPDYPFAGQSNYIVGIFASWNVFDGGKRIYETQKAKDKTKEAEEYLEGLKKNVDFKVFEAYSGVEEANKNYILAQVALITAIEGKILVTQKWQKAKSPFIEVLDSQTNLNKARANLNKSCNELKAQLLTLYYESGIIKQELALETNKDN